MDFYLEQASKIAAELQGLEQGTKTPPYDQIELPAHALGRQLSRAIQEARVRELAVNRLANVPCPTCGNACPVATKNREIHSLDGPVELTETVAQCRRCRRSFFPQRVEFGLDPRESAEFAGLWLADGLACN